MDHLIFISTSKIYQHHSSEGVLFRLQILFPIPTYIGLLTVANHPIINIVYKRSMPVPDCKTQKNGTRMKFKTFSEIPKQSNSKIETSRLELPP